MVGMDEKPELNAWAGGLFSFLLDLSGLKLQAV